VVIDQGVHLVAQDAVGEHRAQAFEAAAGQVPNGVGQVERLNNLLLKLRRIFRAHATEAKRGEVECPVVWLPKIVQGSDRHGLCSCLRRTLQHKPRAPSPLAGFAPMQQRRDSVVVVLTGVVAAVAGSGQPVDRDHAPTSTAFITPGDTSPERPHDSAGHRQPTPAVPRTGSPQVGHERVTTARSDLVDTVETQAVTRDCTQPELR
jgi:hypothetical protein